jgi:hypothetical protein
MTTPTTPELDSAESGVPGDGYMISSWVFIIASVIALAWGVYRLLTYNSDDAIVGGDAYNYQILATRGVGIICAAGVLAVIAATFAIMATWAEHRARK